MGGPDMAPQTPQRSEHPCSAVGAPRYSDRLLSTGPPSPREGRGPSRPRQPHHASARSGAAPPSGSEVSFPREVRGGGLRERGEGVGGDRRHLQRDGDGSHREGRPRTTLQDAAPQMNGALAGLRVIDCSRLIAGGVLATIFADYGADVVKVETPRGGDPLRTWLKERGELWWKVYARGKRSITLNLAHP